MLWEEERAAIREILKADYEVSDRVIDFGTYNEDSKDAVIFQRRDIYRDYEGRENYFFLSYDANDRLRDVELHHGFSIRIENIVFDFSMNIEKIVELLDIFSGERETLSDGEYLFKKLMLTIASSEATGGEGQELSYVFCSKDVQHLLRD